MPTSAPQSPTADGREGFDFLVGRWTVSHRRLKRRLAGCDEWEVFGGKAQAWPLLGGLGCVDDNLLHLPSGDYRAATLRAFDPAARQWSIWWLDGRAPGQLDQPMRGAFSDAVGSFYADDSFEGRPVRVRFLWARTDTSTPRWEQALSPDGGQTWENNWEMAFVRDVSPPP